MRGVFVAQYTQSPRQGRSRKSIALGFALREAQLDLTLVGAMFNAPAILSIFILFSRYYIASVARNRVKGYEPPVLGALDSVSTERRSSPEDLPDHVRSARRMNITTHTAAPTPKSHQG